MDGPRLRQRRGDPSDAGARMHLLPRTGHRQATRNEPSRRP